MTAFAKASDLPSAINTLERLLVWAAMALSSALNGATVSVQQGQGGQPQCQVQIATIASGQTVFAITAYIPTSWAAVNSATEKAFMAAQDVTATALPDVYKTA
jgi:hypothetical protein